MKIVLRHGFSVKATDPCPLITVKGVPKCLDQTCYVKNCPTPKAETTDKPDMLIGMSLYDFREALAKGLWNSKVVEKKGL